MVRSLMIPLGLLVVMSAAIGCGQPSSPTPVAQAPAAPTAKAEEHGHKAGLHGNAVVTIGRDNYHAEPVFEKGGVVKLYLLGADEARVQEVEARPLTAYVTGAGQTEPVSVEFRPAPQSGDADGKASCFVAQLPRELAGRSVEVVIPNVRFPDDRFHIRFASPQAAAHEEAEMPEKVAGSEEERLYLTPGGLYTEADIAANGRMTASQKFQGLKSSHTVKTKPGEKICPISETKASPKFTWIIGGKAYEFCCPPCVDEFVQMAKENPASIQPPEEYMKK